MSPPSNLQVVSLFRSRLRNARNLENYNFREHTIRHVKHDYRMNINASGEELEKIYQAGLEDLKRLKRQLVISQLYPEIASVTENRRMRLIKFD